MPIPSKTISTCRPITALQSERKTDRQKVHKEKWFSLMAVPFEQKLFGLVQVSVQGLRPGLDQSRTLKYGYTLTTTPNYHTNFLTSSSLHKMLKLITKHTVSRNCVLRNSQQNKKTLFPQPSFKARGGIVQCWHIYTLK